MILILKYRCTYELNKNSSIKLIESSHNNKLITYEYENTINIYNTSSDILIPIKKISIDINTCIVSLVIIKACNLLGNYLLAGNNIGEIISFDLQNDVLFDTKVKISENIPVMHLISNSNNTNESNIVNMLAITEDQNFYCIKANFELNSKNISLLKTLKVEYSMPSFCDEILDIKSINKNEIIFSNNDLGLKLYNTKTKLYSIFEGHKDFIMHIYYKNNYISTASKDGTVRVWRYVNDDKENNSSILKCLFILKGHQEAVNCSNLLLNKNKFIVLSSGKDKSIKVWNLIDKLSTTTNNFDISNEQPKKINKSNLTEILHNDEINFIESSDNEKIIATGGEDKVIKLFKFSNISSEVTENINLLSNSMKYLNHLKDLIGHKKCVNDFKFNKYCKIGVSCSNDKKILIWNLDTGGCINSLSGHNGIITKVEWVYYGTHILSAGADGIINLWNLKTSENLVSLNCHQGKIWALSVVNDEGTNEKNKTLKFYTGGNDSYLNLWTDNTKEIEISHLKQKEEIINKNSILREKLAFKSYKEAMIISIEMKYKWNFLENFINYIQFNSYNNINNNEIIDDPVDVILNNRDNFEYYVDNNVNDLSKSNKIQLYNNKKIISEISSIINNNLDFVLGVVLDYYEKSKFKYYVQILVMIIMFNIPSKLGSSNYFNRKVSQKFNEDLLLMIKYNSNKYLNFLDRNINKAYLLDFILEKMTLLPLDKIIN